jgi:hypothetical protein
MSFYIREMPNKSAMLMTREGRRLFTFKSVESALQACRDWYGGIDNRNIIPHISSASVSRHSDRSAA